MQDPNTIKLNEAQETPLDDGRTPPPPLKEWTVMFLFAGDNELAPLLVSQLKEIKGALSHDKVNVVVQFDPSAPGVATKLLHVNRRANGRASQNGHGILQSMDEDTIRAGDIFEGRGLASKRMKEALAGSDSVPALEALKNFLGYCRENLPAKNYVLFLVGHGLVVGNDAFLPDKHPNSAVTLADLGKSLEEFQTEDGGTALQLLVLHSCAMSAIEVAYELKGRAKYVLGSEGISYVGSMPYGKMLRELFAIQTAARSKAVNVEELVEEFYAQALANITDFILTGYSLDLALCSLETDRYDKLTEKIKELVSHLKSALLTERGREMILLAHWDAQSYWEENYTDLYDFCHRLKRRCESLLPALKESEETETLAKLAAACGAVRYLLSPKGARERAAYEEWLQSPEGEPERRTYGEKLPEPVILHADNFGTKYQYSHGLSVYFPWSAPVDDGPPPPAPVAPRSKRRAPETTGTGALQKYAEYRFSKEFGEDGWVEFLKLYFEKTKRQWRSQEESEEFGQSEGVEGQSAERGILALSFHAGALAKESGSYDGTKESGSYGDCSCPTIKNYPTEGVPTGEAAPEEVTLESLTMGVEKKNGRKKREFEVKAFACSPAVLKSIK